MQKETVFSVSQINEYIKMTLESNPVLKNIWLRGEISNFKSNYSSGHLYFSLKDENSSIKAVMFRMSASRLKFQLESGMKVLLHGKISTYTVSGDYQIIVDDVQPDGAGALALAFEQLKKKLEGEGLFAPERKKPIPRFVKRVGVITSASGAALHDIINVSGRRCPSAEIVIYPAFVQGENAPKSLSGGVLFFNNKCPVDLIIIGRGGGSAEDLWAFNDEGLARIIAGSSIPVISAVGHETDFTICDFVADMRAPTPSAAAELAFPDTVELKSKLLNLYRRTEAALGRRIDMLEGRIDLFKKTVEALSPENKLLSRQHSLEKLEGRLDTQILNIYKGAKNTFSMLCLRLEAANPLSVLSHGYAIIEDDAGEPISSVEAVELEQTVKIIMSDGSMSAKIIDKEEKAK